MEQQWAHQSLLWLLILWCNISIEERALATYQRTLAFWFHYVDDTITALQQGDIERFHNHINKHNCDIQFIKEIEENGTIRFLDCLVIKSWQQQLRTAVYRKLTHTDRLLDQSPYTPTSHKATTIKTLARREQLICDSPNALRNENDYLYNACFTKPITNLIFWNSTLTKTMNFMKPTTLVATTVIAIQQQYLT